MINTSEQPDESKVLGEALKASFALLGIKQKDGQEIVGLSKAHLRNLMRDGINPNSKTGELCIYLIRVYRALYALVGGNKEQMAHWIQTPNKAFGNVAPLERMKQIDGLIEVLRYCDGMRGKI